DLDIRQVSDVTLPEHLDVVSALGCVDGESILPGSQTPRLPINQNVGVRRLQANRNRSGGCRSWRWSWWTGRRRIRWRQIARRPWRTRRSAKRPARLDWRRVLSDRWSIRRQRTRFGDFSRREPFHSVGDFKCGVRSQIHVLRGRSVSVAIERDVMLPGTGPQTLKEAVEIVDDAGVVAVDIDLGFFGSHIEPNRGTRI